MAGLPWLRLDSSFHAHDKILALIDDPSRAKWQALSVYIMGLTWSVSVGSDGSIPKSALRVIAGTPQCGRLLVKHQLWDETLTGWQIRNYSERQQLSDETYVVRKQQALGGKKGGCHLHHGPECEGWRTGKHIA